MMAIDSSAQPERGIFINISSFATHIAETVSAEFIPRQRIFAGTGLSPRNYSPFTTAASAAATATQS